MTDALHRIPSRVHPSLRNVSALLILAFAFSLWSGAALGRTLGIGAGAEFATLTAAYAAAAPGDVLQIEDDGVYAESLNILKNGITIQAAPGANPTIRGNAASLRATFFIRAEDVTIRGLTLDGINGSGRVIACYAPSRVAILDNTIVNGNYGVFVNYTYGDPETFRIEGNTLHSNGTDIWLHSGSGARVAFNTAYSDSGSGIAVADYSSGNVLLGNVIHASRPPQELRSRYGILLYGDDNQVLHNQVFGTSRGVSVIRGVGNRLADNTVWDNLYWNIGLMSTLENVLDNNLDHFTGEAFPGGLSLYLDNASFNTIRQHTSRNAGRGLWLNDASGASLDNSVTDSLFVSHPSIGSFGVDARASSLDQAGLSHLGVYGFRSAANPALGVSVLFEDDPLLTERHLLHRTSWALGAGSAGQHLGAGGLDPVDAALSGRDATEALDAFETFNLSGEPGPGGAVVIADPQDGKTRDAGLVSNARYLGDLDLILHYSDHALVNDNYQADLALMLVPGDYDWYFDPATARLRHRINASVDYSWHTFDQPGGSSWAFNRAPRNRSGFLRLTREDDLIRGYVWEGGAWRALATSAQGIPASGALRPAVRVFNNYNDDYEVTIERMVVFTDGDGDGLSDAEEYAIGTFANEADSDHDGLPDGQDIAPTDPGTTASLPTALLGDGRVRLSMARNRAGDVFVIAHSQVAEPAEIALPLSGLAAGTVIDLPLEEASVAAAEGAIADTLQPFVRRLYRVSAGDAHLLAALAPDAPLVEPRDAEWAIDLADFALDLDTGEALNWSLVSVGNDTVSAEIVDGQLHLASTGQGCGAATITVRATNARGEEAQLELPIASLGLLGDNLLVNPGFEAAGAYDTAIPSWSFFTWSGSARLQHDGLASEGDRSARLQGLGSNKSAISQTLHLPAGRYRVSGRVASWDLRPNTQGLASRLFVNFPDRDYVLLNLVSGDSDWTRFEAIFTLDSAQDATLYLYTFGPGYLWFDDLRVQALEPCATDADGVALGGPTGTPLGFSPPVTASDLLLLPYCGDSAMSATPVCQRLAGIDPASLVTPPADGPSTLADFGPGIAVGSGAGYLDVGWQVVMPTDWRGYDYLEVDLTNAGSESIEGLIEIRDTQSTDYWSRVNWNTLFIPGEQTIRIPLQVFVGEKSVIKERRRLDLSAITGLYIDAYDGQVLVNAIRLTVEPPLVTDFAGLLKLDAGTDASPLFHGFTALTEANGYRPEFGYGIRAGSFVARSDDRRHPDELLRDWVSIASGGVDIDLPNGTYHVWMMLEDPGYWELVQNYDWRQVYAEGRLVHSHSMWSGDLWSRWLANAALEDLPGDDVWQRYIPSRYTPVEFEVTVSDGQLSLDFASGDFFTYANTLSALLIWPAEQDAQGQAFVAELWGRMRDHFEIEYVQTEPLAPVHALPASTSEPVPGLLVYQRQFDAEIHAHDWPSEDELVSDLSLDLARGESEPVTLGLYAKTDLALTGVSLDLPGLDVEARVVRHKIRRTAPGGVRFSALPFLLDPLEVTPDAPLALPEGRSQRLWFTVTAPAAIAATEVAGNLTLSLAGGAQVVLPVTVRVAPFALPEADIPYGYLGSLPNYPGGAFADAVLARAEADLIPSLDLLASEGFTAFTGGIGGPAFSGYGSDGQPKLDFTRFDLVMGAADGAFAFAPLSYGGLAPTGYLGLGSYTITDTQTSLGVPHDRVMADVLGAVRAHVQAQGWPEPVYVVGDEPDVSQVDTASDLADSIRAAGGRSAVFTSFGDPLQARAALAEHVDQVYLSLHSLESMQYIQDQGGICGTYNLGGRYARGIYQFRLRTLGCTGGFYQFAYNSSHADPYYALDGREDDLVAALPGAEPGELVPTLEMERFREAVDDYRYLLALEQALEAPVDANAAVEAQAWLDATLAGMGIGHLALDAVEIDGEELDAIRAIARNLTLQVMGLPVP